MHERVHVRARAVKLDSVNASRSFAFYSRISDTDRVYAVLDNYRSLYSEIALINRYLACS